MINEIEHIYGINLLDSTERKALLQSECDKHDLEVEIFEAVNGDSIPQIEGEMLSNYKALNQTIINVINDAIANNYSSIMILEDDVVFSDDMVEKFNEIFTVRNNRTLYHEESVPALDEDGNEILRNGKVRNVIKRTKSVKEVADLDDNWNVLYLGMRAMDASPKIFNNVHRVSKGVLGHAFCLNMSDTVYIGNLLDRLAEMNLQSDLCLADCYKDKDTTFAFAILPSIAKQRSGYSDILKTVVTEKDYS